MTQVVNRADTTTILSATPNPSLLGGTVEFVAVVTPGAATGNVTFREGVVSLATVALVGNTPTFQTSALTAGSHSIVATYDGNTNYANRTSNTVVQVVNYAPLPPVAAPQSVVTPEDTPKGIVLSASDPNNDPLTFSIVSLPAHGMLSNVNGPNLTYTPAPDYFGPDSFTFSANDGNADSNVATIGITVTPVNDAPVAVNDTYDNPEDSGLSAGGPGGLLANDRDVDGDALTVVLVSPPAGKLALSANGSFDYFSPPNFTGRDTFTYRASDGTLQSNLATVTINVTPVNDPPVAGNDGYTTPFNTPLSINAPGVLGNDSDIDGPR